MKKFVVGFMLFLCTPVLSQETGTASRYDYLSFDVGGTYSWLSGYENFSWPIVYPYDSRSNPLAQYVHFSEQGSGLGLKTGLGIDMRIAGAFALRMGLFYRTHLTTNTERRISEPTSRLPNSALPEIERTYKSTWQFTGAEILGRIPLVGERLYGLAGASLSYMLSDKFDLDEQITDAAYSGSYYNLPSASPSGERAFSISGQTSNNFCDVIQFGGKLGLGYFIPLSESIVLSPDVITTIPLGKLTSEEVEFHYTGNAAQTPSLSYIEYQLGIKFVIGEEKRVYQKLAPKTTVIPRSEPAAVVIKPFSFAELRGRVRDGQTNSPEQATLIITDLDRDTTFTETTSITGDYRIPIAREGRYSVTAQSRSHIFSSMLYTVSAAGAIEPATYTFKLLKEEGTQRLLVFYATDQYELQKESNAELDRLVRFMKETPSSIVEISGHTDSMGDERYNQTLSERRAHAVTEYLQRRGIPASA